MSLSLKAGSADALTEVLNSLRLRGQVFCFSELSAPWSLDLPPSQFAYFHVIERGGGWLKLKGEKKALALASGDLVVVPHGQGHFIGDHPTSHSRFKDSRTELLCIYWCHTRIVQDPDDDNDDDNKRLLPTAIIQCHPIRLIKV